MYMSRQKGVVQELNEPADFGGQVFAVEMDKLKTAVLPKLKNFLRRDSLSFVGPLKILGKGEIQPGRDGGRDGIKTGSIPEEGSEEDLNDSCLGKLFKVELFPIG